MSVSSILQKWRINLTFPQILERWREPWRFFHNETHLTDLFRQIQSYSNINSISEIDYEKLNLVACFHDIIYLPQELDNEMQSAKFFLNSCNTITYDHLHIAEMILDTKTHQPKSELSKIFSMFDMDILNRDFDSLIEYERNIYQEYKFLGENYKNKRIQFLIGISENHPNRLNLIKLIGYIELNY